MIKQHKLTQASKADIAEIMTWFPDKESLYRWGGPVFSYPLAEVTFAKDLSIDTLASYSLIDDKHHVLAFGQFYQRLSCCHLARLAVSPKRRGNGLGQELLQQLIEIVQKKLQLTTSSLFVFSDNHSAIKAYKKFGFSIDEYPESIGLDNCLYMTKGS